MTLLLRAGTNVATLDNNGRTPMQLAQSKLKLLQKNSNTGGAEMGKVIVISSHFGCILYEGSNQTFFDNGPNSNKQFALRASKKRTLLLGCLLQNYVHLV